MRLAVIGKGGSGKSVIAGTLARLIARLGHSVLALDLDLNPGLALSLGMPATDLGLSPDAVEATPSAEVTWGVRLKPGLSPEEAIVRYGRPAPDGVTFLQIGNATTLDNPLQPLITAIPWLLNGIRAQRWSVVADLEGGTSSPFEDHARFADHAMIVVEPTPSSILSARRLARILRDDGPPAILGRDFSGPRPG